MSYHTCIFVGHLGKDPEMRYTPAGQAVTNFSLAVNDDYKNSEGEKIKRTIWLRISAWGKLAELCNQYLVKGNMALVEGHLIADNATGGPKLWTGQDGAARANFEINASTVRFLTPKGETENIATEPTKETEEEDAPAF
ncbi:MAG: single-stranded DNA-binding protein [Ignavibacteria bacterium]|nr:single-stranded DNA-binding protein [Ignavibacteria bacterium]